MDLALRDKFIGLWARHFAKAELPITLHYTDRPPCPPATAPAGHGCIIAQLPAVRRGKTLCIDRESVGCAGGKRYLGFGGELRPEFAYFLSCGIPGRVEGERYKKSPEIVREAMARIAPFTAPAGCAVFKRWDKLDEADEPQVVIFYATPDVLSGLFTLSGFDEVDPNSVIAPFGAGCATIAAYPFQEAARPAPRSVVGTFDVSARPFVPPGTVSFATPMSKFARMVENMPESFLITGSWAKVRRRIAAKRKS